MLGYIVAEGGTFSYLFSHSASLLLRIIWDEPNGFRVWCEKDAERLVRELTTWRRVVGFNLLRFDYSVLSTYVPGVYDLLTSSTLDILDDLTRRLGHRVTLESLARATLGRGKPANGVEAVEWFRQGDMARVIEYCRADVMLTRDIYLHGCQLGFVLFTDLKYPAMPRRIQVSW